jgi:hypothetical protein
MKTFLPTSFIWLAAGTQIATILVKECATSSDMYKPRSLYRPAAAIRDNIVFQFATSRQKSIDATIYAKHLQSKALM